MRWKCCSSGMFIDFYEYADPAVRLGQRIRFLTVSMPKAAWGGFFVGVTP